MDLVYYPSLQPQSNYSDYKIRLSNSCNNIAEQLVTEVTTQSIESNILNSKEGSSVNVTNKKNRVRLRWSLKSQDSKLEVLMLSDKQPHYEESLVLSTRSISHHVYNSSGKHGYFSNPFVDNDDAHKWHLSTQDEHIAILTFLVDDPNSIEDELLDSNGILISVDIDSIADKPKEPVTFQSNLKFTPLTLNLKVKVGLATFLVDTIDVVESLESNQPIRDHEYVSFSERIAAKIDSDIAEL